MKLQEAPDDKLIAAFVQIRDQRAQLKAAYDANDTDSKAKQEKIEAEFLRRFHDRGTDSTKAKGIGTAYIKVETRATVADKDVYFNWIREDPEERLTFVEARANKTAILQYKGEHEDIPPGINYSEAQSVGFRRS